MKKAGEWPMSYGEFLFSKWLNKNVVCPRQKHDFCMEELCRSCHKCFRVGKGKKRVNVWVEVKQNRDGHIAHCKEVSFVWGCSQHTREKYNKLS